MPLLLHRVRTAWLIVGGVIAPVLLQVSFIPFVPAPFHRLNLLLVLTVYGTVVLGVRRVVCAAAAAGLLYDLYAPEGFGVEAASLIVSASVVAVCARRLVTNRTLPALLALGMLGGVSHLAAQLAFRWFYRVFHLTPWGSTFAWNFQWWSGELSALALELAALAVLFLRRRALPWGVATLRP